MFAFNIKYFLANQSMKQIGFCIYADARDFTLAKSKPQPKPKLLNHCNWNSSKYCKAEDIDVFWYFCIELFFTRMNEFYDSDQLLRILR